MPLKLRDPNDILLTQERLKRVLKYDSITGYFIWRVTLSNRGPRGAIAGTISRGYVQIRIDGIIHRAHRLAYLYMTGSWPTHFIDHRNEVKADNRWRNIRPATNQQNMTNLMFASKRNFSGLRGVLWPRTPGSRFQAALICNGRHYLGTFDTAEEAHAAYLEKKRELHRFAHFDGRSVKPVSRRKA